MYRILFSLMTTLVLVACSTGGTAPTSQSDPLAQSSAVSVALPGFETSEGTTLRWYSDLVWVDDPEGRYERRAEAMQQILLTELERKGYRFVGAGEDAVYDVVAVVVLGDLEGQEDIARIFKLYPSLAANPEGYNKGNLLVAIAPAGTKQIVWRGAIEIFTNPEKQTTEARTARMEWAAQQLLGSIPNY
jgi:hypothetical protein